MKKEFYKMCYEDWDEGVEIFGIGEEALALEGAYLRLCHKMYRVRGPVSANPNLLAKLWGVHFNTAKAYLDKLIEFGKVTLESGGAHIINTRVAVELHSRGIMSALRAESGRTGGEASGQSRQKHPDLFTSDEANASTDLKQNPHTRVEKEVEVEKEGDKDSCISEPIGFADFWAIYPKRDGQNPRKPAAEKFKTALTKGATVEEILTGVRHFAMDMQARNTVGTVYVPMAKAWLFQEVWREYQVPAPPPKPITKGRFDADNPHNVVAAAERVIELSRQADERGIDLVDAVFGPDPREKNACQGAGTAIVPVLPVGASKPS